MPRGIRKTETNTETGAETPTPTNKTGITDNEYRASIQHRWVEFKAEARCYVEGVSLEAGQEMTLSPAAAYRQRFNAHIKPTKEITWPELSEHQITDLADGDPKVGAAPKEFTLVSPK